MSDDGKNIVALMTEIRGLCEQISTLLGTSDQIVGRKGGHSAASNLVTKHNSQSLGEPRKWFPEFFARFYINDIHPDFLLYIAVILDNREDNTSYPPKGKSEFEGPLLTSGYIKSDKKLKIKWNKDFWPCRWHVYSDDPDYQGEIYTFSEPDAGHWSAQNFQKMRSLALPLVAVKNSDDLEQKVIFPILEDMKKETEKDS